MPEEPLTPVVPDAHGEVGADASAETAPGSASAGAPAPIDTPVFSARQIGRARELLARLYALRRARRFYPSGHPALEQAVGDVCSTLEAYFEEGVDVPLTFYEDELMLGEQLLAQESVLFDQLIRDMTAIGAGSLTFRRGLHPTEVASFAGVIAASPEEVVEAGGVAAMLEAAGVRHVIAADVAVMRQQESLDEEDARKAAKAAYSGALDLMRDLDRLMRASRMLNVTRVKGTVRSLVENVIESKSAMLELAGLKSHDEYTFYHSVNVAILSLALGAMLTRDYRFLSTLGTGALLHDLGKLSIATEIIGKQGPLTSEEWEEIRRHPIYGASITALTHGLDRGATVAVMEHHLRLDLTGYPAKAASSRQHLIGRIVAVADAYDAMTSRRSYSAARRQDEAIETLVRNAGTALDPALVRLFVRLMGLYPPRSVVRLDTGETAIVLGSDVDDVASPRVRIIADASGKMTEPTDVDLAQEPVGARRTIARSIDPATLNIEVADFL